jgi:hypothetical protein
MQIKQTQSELLLIAYFSLQGAPQGLYITALAKAMTNPINSFKRPMHLGKSVTLFATGLLAICASLSAKTPTEEIRELSLKAERGDAKAQYKLGEAYTKGEVVPKDYAKAANWFRKAAEQGLPEAQFILGIIYANGSKVPNRDAEAAKWFRKAAEQGLREAQFNLAIMYRKGEGVPKDYAEAVEWFRKAAQQGLPRAQYFLGAAHALGEGVPRNYVEAYAYWNVAGSKGNETAKKNLELLVKEMTPSQIEKGQLRTRELLKEFEAKEARAKAK